MKKTGIKIVSIALAASLIFSGASASGAGAASDAGGKLKNAGVGLVALLINSVLGTINGVVPDNKNFKPVAERIPDFYTGSEKILKEPAADARWRLGYAQKSLVPDDWQTKDYYLGGFISAKNGMKNKVEQVIDDMRVRVIALSDAPGRGVSVFATVDAIGVSNGEIKTIRKYLLELVPGVKLTSVNVSSTHCHSCIDVQGLWTNLFSKLGKNLIKAYIPGAKMERGADPEFIEFLCRSVAETMKKAIDDMTPGIMTYSVKTLNPDYFDNRNRKSATAHMSDMARFIFAPNDKSKTPTMIVNIAAHPDVAGLPVSDVDNGRQLSGDYVYYMGETIEKAGYNFMFFNGAIAGMYEGRGLTNDNLSLDRRYKQSERYGIEMGKIALNLNRKESEIAAAADWGTINEEKALGGDGYSLWFEGWGEEPADRRELSPLLNIRIDEARVRITNPLIKLVGKLNLVNYDVYKELCQYYVFVEIGYLQIGDVKIALMPGEIIQDLVAGGDSLTAEGSYSGEDFGRKTIRELFGEDTLCFGLTNDAIGYVVPDNDYALAGVDDHYHELISLGRVTASSIMDGFAKMAEELGA